MVLVAQQQPIEELEPRRLNLPNFKRKTVTETKKESTLESDNSVSDDMETFNVILQMSKHSLIDNSDEDSDYCFSLSKQKQKSTHMCTQVVGQIHDSTGELVPIYMLLSTFQSLREEPA